MFYCFFWPFLAQQRSNGPNENQTPGSKAQGHLKFLPLGSKARQLPRRTARPWDPQGVHTIHPSGRLGRCWRRPFGLQFPRLSLGPRRPWSETSPPCPAAPRPSHLSCPSLQSSALCCSRRQGWRRPWSAGLHYRGFGRWWPWRRQSGTPRSSAEPMLRSPTPPPLGTLKSVSGKTNRSADFSFEASRPFMICNCNIVLNTKRFQTDQVHRLNRSHNWTFTNSLPF